MKKFETLEELEVASVLEPPLYCEEALVGDRVYIWNRNHWMACHRKKNDRRERLRTLLWTP